MQNRAAALTFVEKLAGVVWHFLDLAVSALGAGDLGAKFGLRGHGDCSSSFGLYRIGPPAPANCRIAGIAKRTR
jgi:hypothetical protein